MPGWAASGTALGWRCFIEAFQPRHWAADADRIDPPPSHRLPAGLGLKRLDVPAQA